MSNTQNPSFFQENATTVKGVLIAILALVLLIPTNMVESIIYDRENRRATAISEISEKWGAPQTIIGPVLSVPYLAESKDENGKKKIEQNFVHFLPDSLQINSKVTPEKRTRGIYEVVVYQSDVTISGQFSAMKTRASEVMSGQLQWENAVLTIGISDLRGIDEQIELQWNNDKKLFNPGVLTTDFASSGVHAPVSLKDNTAQTVHFSTRIQMKGSDKLMFTPVGKVTKVQMESPWANPSFGGAFLPDTRNITPNGFTADWKVLHLNRNFPQTWMSQTVDIAATGFGVNLLLPVDSYQKATRATKYAILFIALTFIAFFFNEMRGSGRVHPFQYVLIGLALVIFYTLLISISEYLGFNTAYWIAATMTVVLVTLYARSLFASAAMSNLIGGTLVLLYVFLFTLIQLQDYALLIGSIGLFAILAGLMYLSRKIDWYEAR
jgi:inner membrane protein